MASSVSHGRQASRLQGERQRRVLSSNMPLEGLPAEEQQRLAALLRDGVVQSPVQITPALAGQIGNRALSKLANVSRRVQRQTSPDEEEPQGAAEATERAAAPSMEGGSATPEASAGVPSNDRDEFVPDEGSLTTSLEMMGRPPERRNFIGPPKPGQMGGADQIVQQPPVKAPGLEGGVKSEVGATTEAAGAATTVAGVEPIAVGASPATAAPAPAGLEAAPRGEGTFAEPPEGAVGAVEPGRAAGPPVESEREAAGAEEGVASASIEAPGSRAAATGALQGRETNRRATTQVASQAEAVDSEQAGREESQAREAGEEARQEAQAEETERAIPEPSTGPEALAPPEGESGAVAQERAESVAVRVRSLVQRGAQLLAQGARSVVSFLSGMVGGPAAAVLRVIGAISDFASRTVSRVGQIIRSAVGPIMTIISTVASTALGFLRQAYNAVRDVVGRLISGAGRLIEAARERGRALARRMYQGVVNLVRRTRTGVTAAVRSAVGILVRVVGQAANAARTGIRNLARRVRQGIAAARQRVRGFLDRALGGESPLAPRYAARVRQRLRQIARQRLVRLPEIMARVRLATVVPLLAIVGSMGNAVRTVWNGVRDTFREVFAEPARTVQEHAPEIGAEVQLAVGDGETLATELEAAAQQELVATETTLAEVEGDLRVEAEVTGETL